MSASSRRDGELGEINQLFEGDEPNPISSDLAEDPVKGRMWSVITHLRARKAKPPSCTVRLLVRVVRVRNFK